MVFNGCPKFTLSLRVVFFVLIVRASQMVFNGCSEFSDPTYTRLRRVSNE